MTNSRMRVLIVDDSAFFRHRIEEVLKHAPDIEIIGYASDGRQAVQKAEALNPDLITMDVRMPGMDGIAAVRHIMAAHPTRILMFSALTKEGARETLEALEAGAIDFLPKQPDTAGMGAISYDFASLFLERVRAVGRSQFMLRHVVADSHRDTESTRPPRLVRQSLSEKIKLVAIGASTGGPVAVQSVLSSLPRDFSLPIVVAIHMPGSFTAAYAERLNMVSSIDVRQATDSDALLPGCALIAPGGKQVTVEHGGSTGLIVRVKDALPGEVYHPSVDRLFHSAAQVLGGRVLAVVLTGMGSDGLQGAIRVKETGGIVWSQDEGSSVVYGMPQVVEKAGLSDRVLPINTMGLQLMSVL